MTTLHALSKMRFFVLSSPRLNKKSIQTSESDELRVESYQERKKSNSNSNPKPCPGSTELFLKDCILILTELI